MIDAFEKFYDSGWYILGESVKSFENSYAEFTNSKFCIGVSNGLDALFLSLKSLEIGKGDEVIVPSNTYIATLLAITYTGATPVLAEPNIKTYNIDADVIDSLINSRTKAILPVHLYGQACEMEPIMNLANKYSLYVIEDNAQSHGASYNDKKTGSWGNANATSFYPGKNLGALGDAGAITTNSEVLEKKLRILRNYGSAKKYYNELVGYNMRMDECHAAFLSIKLKHLDILTSQRQQIAQWYNEALAQNANIILPAAAKGATHVYHLYVIRAPDRDKLQAHLTSKNIGTLIHYPVPPHLQKAYAGSGWKKGQFPIAEELANTCLSLPLWPGMTKEMVLKVTKAIHEFYN